MRRDEIVWQVNLSGSLGGAEVYTAFSVRALLSRGYATKLVVKPGAAFWREELGLGGAELSTDLRIPRGALVLIHAPVERGLLENWRDGCLLCGFAHQALYNDNRPAYYELSHRLLAVSRHVAEGLRRRGLQDVYPEPLYGVADLERAGIGGSIQQGPLVEWDRRKLRDLALRVIESLRPKTRATFAKRGGLTLAIVSRLAPLKQYPALFREIAPILAARREVSVEIFGAAVGYRALREMRTALAPLGVRARFWGYQRDVGTVYRSVDYLLAGLPEREALGLNLIEAQASGTPVLAVRASPFTETVVDGETGYFFTDPREDGGADFARLLDRIRASPRPDPAKATSHLARFSFDAFAIRLERALCAVVHG